VGKCRCYRRTCAKALRKSKEAHLKRVLSRPPQSKSEKRVVCFPSPLPLPRLATQGARRATAYDNRHQSWLRVWRIILKDGQEAFLSKKSKELRADLAIVKDPDAPPRPRQERERTSLLRLGGRTEAFSMTMSHHSLKLRGYNRSRWVRSGIEEGRNGRVTGRGCRRGTTRQKGFSDH
jgi:hypothetical protein